MFAAAAMSLSSFCVVTNALRLNLFKVRGKAKKEEEKGMEVILKVKGMMCGHCEARVKAALEAIPGVASAQVSHKKGRAVVALSGEAAVEDLVKAVVDAGYEVRT
jgi:Cu2+-exporting ATPase